MSKSKLLQKKLTAEQQYNILSSGAVEIINKEEFLEKLKEKKSLKVKAGFDPSRPDIHIGHSVLIHKLCQFQDLGHEVIFVVGDFTACIGDPSGQNKTRPLLSVLEVKDNSQTYIKQATKENFIISEELDSDSQKILSFFKRLDLKKTKWLYNSKWFNKISLRDFILSVASKFTVARQLERNDFSSRYKNRKPIGLHEFFYPILQAYDSVQIEADIEIGGTDQTFNLLLGRDLQQEYKQKPQVVLTLPLLEGLDGKQKMSKSFDNAISFNDSPKDIYGKIMKISDELLIRYWNVFTEGKKDLNKKNYHPKKEKEKLAWLLVSSFYGEKKAHETQKEFVRIFSNKGLPDQILEEQDIETKEIGICDLLKKIGLESSNSSARRAILSGAVKKDGKKLTDPKIVIDLTKNKEFLLSFGKRNFKRINLKWETIHELKAYFIYRKIKEGLEKKEKVFINEDLEFKKADISLNSLKMKIENYRYLDSEGNEGLSNCSKKTKEIFNNWKDSSIEDLKKKIRSTEKR
ncbi:MAG: tyrosine--tRNA ligase [Bdellovibrionaceae bacterium]|nr:tyrosine--tRNA ligase [Pseudobdellovibrionaceae bacterium]